MVVRADVTPDEESISSLIEYETARPELRELWQEIKDSPDMTFVTVEEDDESVRVWKEAGYLKVHVLENDEFRMGQVRFLGCTLWTDFELFNDPEMDALSAQKRMNDFKIIHLSPEKRPLGPLDTVTWHNQSKQWLEKKAVLEQILVEWS